MLDPSAADRDRRIDEAVAAFLRAEQAGRPLDPPSWLLTHPDLWPELEKFLADWTAARAAFALALTPPPPAGFEPGAEFDGLRVVREIGRGGMGRVYEAVQLGLDRRVAVKTVRAVGPADAYRLLFADEVRAVGRLKHPGIVPVYGCGERGGWPYLVMGLMAGSLADRLAAGPLPPAEAAGIVAAVARAVGHAHEWGFLHRDIKPSNVLLDEHGVPHLADFGLVARLGELDQTGRAGTAGYMAPEQFAGSVTAVDERADVYGLGAVLYACLTGRSPVPAGAAAWAEPPPRQVHPAADRRLEAVCRRCLAHNPAARPPSAGELASELERALRPPRRRMVGAAGALCLVVAIAGGWFGWPTDPAQRLRSERYQRLVVDVQERASSRPPDPGWTWEHRDALAEAARIDTPERNLVFLRSELARTFAHPDVRELGTLAPGRKYEVAAFRPGTGGDEIALGVCLRDRDADPAAPVRVALFDRRADRLTRTWDLPFAAAWEQRRGRADGVRGLAFAPDGHWLFAGTRGGGVYAIDLAAPAAPPLTLMQDAEAVKHLFPAADGRSLVSVALDGRVRRFRLAAGRWEQDREVAFPTPWPSESWEANAAVLPATGDVVVLTHRLTGPVDTTTLYRFSRALDVLDRQDLGTLVRLPAPHPTAPVTLVDFAGRPCPVQLDQLTARSLPDVAAGLDSRIPKYTEQIRFSPDGRVLVTSCDGDAGVVKFWDAATFAPLGSRPCPNGSGQVAFAPDAPFFTVAAEDRVYLFEWAAGGPELRVGWHPAAVEAVGVAADGSVVRTATRNAIYSWGADGRGRTARGDFVQHVVGWSGQLSPVGPAGFAMAIAPGLGFAVTEGRPPQRLNSGPHHTSWQTTADGTYWAFGGQTLRRYSAFRGGLSACNSPDAQHLWAVDRRLPGEPLLLAARRGRAVVYMTGRYAAAIEADAGAMTVRGVRPLRGPRWTAAAFAPDGGEAVVGDDDGRVGLVRWPNPEPTGWAAGAHTQTVTSVAWLAPGLVATGGEDRAVALFRVSGNRLVLLGKLPLGQPVIALSTDGVVLAAVCRGERVARVWQLDQLEAEWTKAGLSAGLAPARLAVPADPWPAIPPRADLVGPGLCRRLFRGQFWEECVATDLDPSLSHDWDAAPPPGVADLNEWFSGEWSGGLQPDVAGRYRFRVSADNHASVFVGDCVVAHTYSPTPDGQHVEGEVELAAARRPFRVEYSNHGGPARLRVEWKRLGPGGFDWREIDPKHLSPHPPK